MDNKRAQGRKILLTINNPEKYGITAAVIEQKLSTIKTDYYCFAKEKDSTEHYHIFIYRNASYNFTTIKKLFETAHIEFAKGTVLENKEYVCKEGKWLENEKAKTSIPGTFVEKGKRPVECPATR